MLKYCKDDVNVLWEACEKYRIIFDSITKTDPFAFCTLASHCQYIYGSLFMPEDSIPLIPDEFNLKSNSSKKEIQWIKYLDNPNIKQHQRVFIDDKSYIVDGFDGETVFQFYGCYWHGCIKCYPEGFNSVNKKSFKMLNNITQTINKVIKKRYKVHYIWECDFDNLSKIDDMPNVDEYTPLIQKESMIGGRTEVFKSYEKNIKNGGYVDFTSLYPTVNKYDYYPSGKRTVVKNPSIWDPNMVSFAKVKIQSPSDMLYPILPVKDDKLLFKLGTFIGTWTTVEINYAVERGYKILKIYEVHKYEHKRTDLFKDYVNTFLKIKQEASGFPRNRLTSEQQKHGGDRDQLRTEKQLDEYVKW